MKGLRDIMKEIVDLIVQNGIGVGSFIALLYFGYIVLKDIKEVLEDIKKGIEDTSKTLVLVQDNLKSVHDNLASLEGRVKTIENKVERNYEE